MKSSMVCFSLKLFQTLLKIRVSSDSDLPNMASRSHHLFGYASRRSRIISASILVAIVP